MSCIGIQWVAMRERLGHGRGATLLLIAATVVTLEAGVSAQDPAPLLALQGGGTNLSTPTVSFGDEGRLLIESDQNRVRVFDVASGRVVRTIAPSPSTPLLGTASLGLAFAAHPRAPVLALYQPDGSVAALDVVSGRELWRTPPLTTDRAVLNVRAFARFSSDGEILAVEFGAVKPTVTFGAAFRQAFSRGNSDSVSMVRARWRIRDQKLLGKETIRGPFESLPSTEWVSSDGDWFVTTRTSRGAFLSQVREIATGKPIGPELAGTVVAAHAGAARAVVDEGGVSRLVALPSGTTVVAQFGGSGAFSLDGTRFLAGTAMSAWWTVSDVRTGAMVGQSSSEAPIGVAWAISPDGRLVATVQQNRVVIARPDDAPVRFAFVEADADQELLTAATFQPTDGPTDPRLEGIVRSMQVEVAAGFSSEGRWFVARAQDGSVDVWDAATGSRMPFRLSSSGSTKGPLAVDAHAAGTGSVDAWHPISVGSLGAPWGTSDGVTRIPGALGIQSVCRSRESGEGAFEVLEGINGDGYHAVLRDRRTDRVVLDLVPLGVDLRASCSIDETGRYLVVAGVDPKRINRRSRPQARLSDSLGCRMFLRCSTPLVVFDVARQQVLAHLRDYSADRGAADTEFPFSAGELTWSDEAAIVYVGRGTFPPREDVQAIRAWDFRSGEELDLASRGLSGTSVGVIAGTRWIVLRTSVAPAAAPITGDGGQVAVPAASSSTFDIWDLQRLQRVARLPALDDAGLGPASAIATNGAVLVGAGADAALWIRRLADGELLGTLRPLGNGEWIVASPSGLFDGSPGGWRQIAWRGPNSTSVEPGELFFSEFYQPGLLADLLAGRSPRPIRPVMERDRRQPAVSIEAALADERTANVRLRVVAAAGAANSPGVRDLRLFRNGILVRAWRGELQTDTAGEFAVEARVPLVSGENRFVAYVFNRDDIKSRDAAALVTSTAPARAGTVFVLAIGVNRYANPAFDLTYAVADASTFAASVAARQRELGAARVEIVTLLDTEATRANILLALDRLSGRSSGSVPAGAPAALAALPAAQPEDTVIMYYAGHGFATSDRFHLIPADMAYRGPRTGMAAALPAVLARTISDQDLERAFEPLDAAHLLLVIDACNSGQAIESEETRFGPLNSRGLAQLAYEKGMSILTASQAYQAALESAQLGHGYLTYALVKEGLESRAADRQPADGEVTAEEWFTYAAARVPQLQLEALDHAQAAGRILTFDGAGTTAGKGRLQTPRVFSRRDSAERPLVVARP